MSAIKSTIGRHQTGLFRIEVVALVMLMTALALVLTTDFYATWHAQASTVAQSVPSNDHRKLTVDGRATDTATPQSLATIETEAR